MIAITLLVWFKLLALDGDLARAAPKALRYRLPHALSQRVTALASSLSSAKPFADQERTPRALWNPRRCQGQLPVAEFEQAPGPGGKVLALIVS